MTSIGGTLQPPWQTPPGLAGGPASQSWVEANFQRPDGRIIAADPRFGVPYSRAALLNALDAAEDAGSGTIVYLPTGAAFDVETTLSLAGRSCVIQGGGSGGTIAAPGGSQLYASAQSGPVLDLSGWVAPEDAGGRLRFGGFMLRGSAVADATKNNAGLRTDSLNSVDFADIAIRDTGGPCLDLAATTPGSATYLCDFDRFTLMTPVGAKTNDVPYMRGVEANGNRFRSFGLRSILSAGDVGVSGAVQFLSSATFAATFNEFSAWWYENLHVPTDGTLFLMQGTQNFIDNFEFFDCAAELGATGTSYYRFTAPTSGDYGGNELHGVIPGNSGSASTIAVGVDMRQSHNRVIGVKGYQGTNVQLAAGVGYTHAELGGAVSGALVAAFVDNSGQSTNTLLDHVMKQYRYGTYSQQGGTASIGPTFYDPANVGNGGVNLGQSGVRFQSVGKDGYLTADRLFLRNTALSAFLGFYLGNSSSAPGLFVGSGSPEGVQVGAPGSLYVNIAGGVGTTLYVKESGTGNTGWAAK